MFRQELAPTHGRMAGSLRTALAATIAALIVLTLRMHVMAQGVFLLFLMSYETPYLTFKRSFAALLLQCTGIAVALCLIIATGNDPMARVLGVAIFTFIAGFVRRTQARFIQVVDFAIFATSTIYAFDIPQQADLSIKMAIWPIATGAIAVGCKVAIEYIFTRRNPFYALYREIDVRLDALEQLFYLYGSEADAGAVQAQAAKVRRYAFMGQGKMYALAQEIDDRHKKDAVRDIAPGTIPVLARLLDLAAAYAVHHDPDELSGNKERLNRLARALAAVREADWDKASLLLNATCRFSKDELGQLGRTLGMLIALSAEGKTPESALSGEAQAALSDTRWFLPDAFTNFEYVVFAFKISLCATLCYVIFNALAWPGIQTAVTTVVVAGLGTAGATNQKLLHRFVGSALGGLVFGIGGIVFLFPYVDTVTPFLIAIAAVSFIAAWVARSAHIGYIGLQIALSFFYVAFEGFSAPTQMAPARDRLVGILLGLVIMMLIFRPEKGVDRMRKELAGLLATQADYLQAAVFHVPVSSGQLKAMELRNKMQRQANAARGFAEMIPYEFSQEREQHIQASEKINTAIASAEDLLLSMNSWPHEGGTGFDDASVRQSRAALENGLRSLAAILQRNAESEVKPEVEDGKLFGQLADAAPSYIGNSIEIYKELQLQCGEIASCD
jgi:multidrug resistance protein MdtO